MDTSPKIDEPSGTRKVWTLPPEAVLPDDPLTASLVVLTRLFNRPFSAQTLTAGLPLVASRLTPDLFPRAAARAGLSARVVRRALNDISPLTLPAVLLLKEGRACVVQERDDSGRWRVIQPESGAGEAWLTAADLAEDYTGYAIFVRVAFKFDERADRSAVPRTDHWFWGVVRHAWPLYSEVLIASLLVNIFALVSPLFIMNVYDRVVPNQAYETLWVLAIGVGIVVVFDFLMRSLRSYFIDVAGKQIEVMLSANIFEKVLGLRTEVRPASVGAFANNLQEFDSFRDFITSATIATLVDLPFVLFFIVIIGWIGGPMIFVPLFFGPIIVGLGVILQRPLENVVRRTLQAATQKQATLIETLTGVETIKAVGAESPTQRKWEQIVGEMGRLSLKSRLLSTLIVNQAVFFQQIATVVLIVVGVYQIADRDLTTGGLIACTILLGRALAPLSSIAALMTRYYQAMAGLKGIDSIMQLPVERPTGEHFVQRPEFKGDIEFRDLSFNYPGQDLPALSNVSFRISRGERVGLIGRIGSGKTTIEKLLLGLYQPTSGSIWIDGIDLKQIDPADLRHHVGYVPQDVTLFYGTVRDNIVFGAPYVDDAAMLAAADIAGVTEFVNRHPRGFEMPVGERGEGLSGGQRQAVSIARAMLLAPPILVLDEPTNSLDNRSEENFKRHLADYLTPERTLILVTHRASLLSLVDRLIVLDSGRIIADGPKNRVLDALAGGKVHAAHP